VWGAVRSLFIPEPTSVELFNFGIDIFQGESTANDINFHYVFRIVILRIFPLPLILPNTLLNSMGSLRDRKIFRERFDGLIMLKFLAPIISFCRVRQNFDNDGRIKQRVIFRIIEFLFFTGDNNVRICVFPAPTVAFKIGPAG
jgi:hypothetical protein